MSSDALNATRVFIVEDEPLIAMDLESMLQDLGYVVTGQAHTVSDALRDIAQIQPEVVLMDIELQGLGSGVEAASTIRERWGIPVIFVTGNVNPKTIGRAKASGPHGFVSKPFRARDLDATIDIAVKQHRLTQELFAERGWFTSLLAGFSDGVIATDAEGFVSYMNSAAEKLVNWSLADALRLPIERVYPPSTLNNAPVKQCQVRKALATLQSIPSQRFLMHVREDGIVPIEDAAAPILAQGRLLGAVTIFRDISQQLEREKLAQVETQSLQKQVQVTTKALGASRQELQELTHYLMRVQETERARVARELHDDLGQQGALLSMKMQRLYREAPSTLRPAIKTILEDVGELSRRIRMVSHHLHPSILADLGLIPALQSLTRDCRECGVNVEFEALIAPRLPLPAATACYRIVQEALNNVCKHVPNALVEVKVNLNGRLLEISVCDQGRGFSPAELRKSRGLGLISMQERARLVGATFELSSKPGLGTRVVVRVLLDSKD